MENANFAECLELLVAFDKLEDPSKYEELLTGLEAAQNYVAHCAGVPIWYVAESAFNGDELPEDIRKAFDGRHDVPERFAQLELPFPDEEYYPERSDYVFEEEDYDYAASDRAYDAWREG